MMTLSQLVQLEQLKHETGLKNGELLHAWREKFMPRLGYYNGSNSERARKPAVQKNLVEEYCPRFKQGKTADTYCMVVDAFCAGLIDERTMWSRL